MRLHVIPYPSAVDYVGPGTYQLPPCPAIALEDGSLIGRAHYLQRSLLARFGAPSTIAADGESGAAITLALVDRQERLQQQARSGEAYLLSCGQGGVRITALTDCGVFHGIQTLLQALQPTPQGPAMPHTSLLDAPRFAWRGVLLDVSRHFFPVPFILKVLDLMALYKLNRFHWHLTDDQGWRLEVPSLPRLAEVSAWRGKPPPADAGGSCGSGVPAQQQGQQQQQQPAPAGAASRAEAAAAASAAASAAAAAITGRAAAGAAEYHGGFYSTADVDRVVAYAAERCIEVVPEIELPGHCCAALAAFPHLSCTGDVPAVSTHWGIHEDVYCAGSDEVFSFLERVLDQVVERFPCRYVHVGGDEVPKLRWEECARCQARMRQEGLSSEAELQSWFVRRVSKLLAARNRRLIGWDEILEGGLAEGATVMSWRGNVGGIIAAKSGHDVIMTPTSHCYFDYRQAPSASEPGAWYACLPLHVVYSYDPVPAGPWPAGLGGSGGDGAESPDSSPEQPPLPQQQQQQQQQQQVEGGDVAMGEAQGAEPPAPLAATPTDIAATDPAAAAAAAGPHFPGDPPGTALAPLAAAAGAAPPPAPAAAAAQQGAAAANGGCMLTDAEAARVLGSQANLWCEYVQDEDTAEYMLLPRLAALAEAVWTPVAAKDWAGFLARLSEHLPLLHSLGYKYRPLD